MSDGRICPKCKAPDAQRVKRTLFDRLMLRRKVYLCDYCQCRFAVNGSGQRKAAHARQ